MGYRAWTSRSGFPIIETLKILWRAVRTLKKPTHLALLIPVRKNVIVLLLICGRNCRALFADSITAISILKKLVH